MIPPGSLDRPVDRDGHLLGPSDAEITLVEYGSYACPHSRISPRVLGSEIIGELAKDISRRPLEDIASLIADA